MEDLKVAELANCERKTTKLNTKFYDNLGGKPRKPGKLLMKRNYEIKSEI